MKSLAILAASIALGASVVARGPYRPIEESDAFDLFSGPDVGALFPSLLPEPLSPRDSDAYTEYLQAQAEAQRPTVEAARAKRERRRLKRMRDQK